MNDDKFPNNDLRKKFIGYFAQRKHRIVDSDSLIPSSDPSLLLTSAGMVQFKKYFSKAEPGFERATSCQKCFRTSDIDSIGRTQRHLSFFEMLGNFSFGDYFKKETIAMAWEFLTKEIGLDSSRLYITVYKEDDEALEMWKGIVPAGRIYKMGDKTNFWNMGPTGPCGPCSEIMYDLGSDIGCGNPGCDATCECDRWLEVWNLVFTQYDRQADGKLLPLPQKNIDTGMGLERLAAVANGRKSVFETDLFMPLINELEDAFGSKYGKDSGDDVILKMVADHSRAAAFLISDGIFPSNEGRGYVLRRIIRRALRQGRLSGMKEPFLYKLTGKVVEMMKEAYPALAAQRENIAMITRMEEEKFLEALDTGLNLLNGIMERASREKAANISGEDVFRLYDTYGFPPELTKEILAERGLAYDEKEYARFHGEAQENARKSWKGTVMADTSLYRKYAPVKFTGYEELQSAATVKAIIKGNREADALGEGEEGEIILDSTPFYGESGGQSGDSGRIAFDNSNWAEVLDTQKPAEGVTSHKVKVAKGKLSPGQKVTASVEVKQRAATMRHHTATHLLHKALREIVGTHATQAGSLVTPDRLRFDYNHFKGLSGEEKDAIERSVNENIMRCLGVQVIVTENKRAKDLGAMALFGEKYGISVRCVIIGGEIARDASGGPVLSRPAESIELCGGTHCANTGEIGFFKLLSESSVGSNLRRIEAVCGARAREYVNQNEELIAEASARLKSEPEEMISKLDKLLKSQKKLEDEIKSLEEKLLTGNSSQTVKEYDLKGARLVLQLAENMPAGALRSAADRLNDKYTEKCVIMVLNSGEDKINFVVKLTKDMTDSGKADAGEIAKKLAALFEGSGGGRKDFAQGGGRKQDKLDEKAVVSAITTLVK